MYQNKGPILGSKKRNSRASNSDATVYWVQTNAYFIDNDCISHNIRMRSWAVEWMIVWKTTPKFYNSHTGGVGICSTYFILTWCGNTHVKNFGTIWNETDQLDVKSGLPIFQRNSHNKNNKYFCVYICCSKIGYMFCVSKVTPYWATLKRGSTARVLW